MNITKKLQNRPVFVINSLGNHSEYLAGGIGLIPKPWQWLWWWVLGCVVAQRFRKQGLAQVAGSLTFTTVLSLVPLVTVALAVLTAFPVFGRIQSSLQAYLLDGFFPDSLATVILTYVNQFSAKAKGLTAVGVVFLMVTAMSTMLTVDKVFNQLWRVRRQRSLVHKVMLYWTVISLAPVLLGFSLSTTTQWVVFSLKGLGASRGGLAPVLALIPVLFTVLAFAFVYRLVPNRHVHWRDALCGALVAALLFEAAKRGFAAYIAHFPSYTALYGALAAFPLFLLWLFVSWLVVLFGATVAAALPVVRSGNWQAHSTPGQVWLQGLAVLGALNQARQATPPGLTLSQLRLKVAVPPDVLDDIVYALQDAGLVAEVFGLQGKERLALVCDPETLPAAKAAQALWFNGEILPAWTARLPKAQALLNTFYQERLQNLSLAVWLKQEVGGVSDNQRIESGE